jgi:hypothetical protein
MNHSKYSYTCVIDISCYLSDAIMSNSFEENAKKLALNAVNLDKSNLHELAISFYIVNSIDSKCLTKILSSTIKIASF